jgi:hypothetical protein
VLCSVTRPGGKLAFSYADPAPVWSGGRLGAPMGRRKLILPQARK